MGVVKDIQTDLEIASVKMMTECRSRLLVYALRICGNPTDAEDLVGSAFKEFFAHIEGYDSKKGELYPYLKGILDHLHARTKRRAVNRGTVAVDPSVLESDETLVTTCTEDEILANSDHDALRAAIGRLPPKSREVILLHYFSELPVAKVARVLGISGGTVKWRLNMARKALATDLGRTFDCGKKPLAVILVALVTLVSAAAVATLPAFEPLRATVAGWFGASVETPVETPSRAVAAAAPAVREETKTNGQLEVVKEETQEMNKITNAIAAAVSATILSTNVAAAESTASRPAKTAAVQSAAPVKLAAAAATVSAASESTKRSMSIVSVDDENVTVALSAFNAPQRLFWCYGQFDRKADLNAWEHREFVGNVGAESTNVTVKLPVGWGSSVSCLRFVLVEQSEFDEEFEYVTAGGTYIDTGVNDNEIRPKVEVKWSPMADGNANNPEAMFASGFSPGCIQFWSHVLRMGGGSHSELVVGGQVYVDFADTRSYTITRNGVPYLATSGAYSYSPANANFLLFARQGSAGGTSNSISARFYSCKIWDARENGDVLVRDFVPCRRGGVVQLYDRVTKMPYMPGKGELQAGPASIPQAESISDLVAVNGWREVYVQGGIYSGRKLKSVRIAFGPGTFDEVLYVGYGANDCGQVFSSWPYTRRVKEVACGKTQCSVEVPAGWGDSVTHMRFFLGKEQPSPVETEWEYADYVSGILHVLVPAKDAPRPIVEFKWRPLVESSGTQIVLASAKGGVGGTGIQVFSNYLRMGADNKQAAEVTTVKDADYTDVFDNVALTVSRNGEMLSPSSSPSFATFANGEDFSVFSRYGQYLYPSRFYSLKIWSGLDGVLRHYCVPGMKDGEAVVYDKVTKNVYRRTGGTSDSLVVGGASVPSEAVYNPLSFTDVVECTQKLPNVAGMMVIIK